MTTTQNRLWTVDEYHRMIEAGILTTEDKVELLEGRIIQMSAQRPPHAATTQRIDRYFQNLLRGQADIRSQLPITLSTSEPEPDIAVVRIDPGGYADHHPAPNEILLLIEVAHTTLRQSDTLSLAVGLSDRWSVATQSSIALSHPARQMSAKFPKGYSVRQRVFCI